MFILNLINWEDLEFLDYLTGVREKLVEINVIWDGSKIEERLIRCLRRLVLFVQFGTKHKKKYMNIFVTCLNYYPNLTSINAYEKKNIKFDFEFWKFYFWHIKSDSVWKKMKKSNLTKKKIVRSWGECLFWNVKRWFMYVFFDSCKLKDRHVA